jgi:hypothetical protein
MKGRRLEHDLGAGFQQYQFGLAERARPSDDLNLAGGDIDCPLMVTGLDLVSCTAGEHDFGEHQKVLTGEVNPSEVPAIKVNSTPLAHVLGISSSL